MKNNIKIGIIGLGLIGGSIFKALSNKYEVLGICRSDKTFALAKAFSANVSKSKEDLKSCDVVFVCVHMNKTVEILKELDSILSKNTIVLDVCSLKGFLKDEKHPYKFIPSHPMAGTEFSGFENSFETLFEKAKWVLTPDKETKKEDITAITGLIEEMGAEPVFATPTEHDQAVALISHMPMLVSQALFKTAEPSNLAMKLASSGFRDMTRLALSNEEMAEDMITLNSENVQKSILELYSSIGNLLKSDYKNQIKDLKAKREKMYIDGKNTL